MGGGGIALDLPFVCRPLLADTSRFSLSDENEAAGDGDNEPGLADGRPGRWRVEVERDN